LVITPTGFVSDCQIAESSGNQDLDMQTCRIAIQRMRFAPARDEKNRPVESVYRLPVRWSIPKPTVPVMPVPTATTAPAGG
jgi:protein TonB